MDVCTQLPLGHIVLRPNILSADGDCSFQTKEKFSVVLCRPSQVAFGNQHSV